MHQVSERQGWFPTANTSQLRHDHSPATKAGTTHNPVGCCNWQEGLCQHLLLGPRFLWMVYKAVHSEDMVDQEGYTTDEEAKVGGKRNSGPITWLFCARFAYTAPRRPASQALAGGV